VKLTATLNAKLRGAAKSLVGEQVVVVVVAVPVAGVRVVAVAKYEEAKMPAPITTPAMTMAAPIRV
jgi:hypothetical protein